MQLKIQKMQGAGNRILIVDQRSGDSLLPSAKTLDAVRNSEWGADFDQLMWLSTAQDHAAVASYRVFNFDGSEVEQCGNGVRCVAVSLAGQQPGMIVYLILFV